MRWVALPDGSLLWPGTASRAGLASHPEKDFCFKMFYDYFMRNEER
jgi:hypothetical protein